MSEEWNGATSTVKLYKKCLIIPEKNFIVDDIDSYLATLELTEVNRYQYIKHSLMLDVKFNQSQVLQEYDNLNDYNYLTIKNSDSNKIVYYFIKKRVVRANQTILFELEMDVLNTFKWNEDYAVSPRTNVIREHKARWQTGRDGKYHPVIDFYSEGIQVPTYRSLKTKLQENKVDDTWYLIYKNRSNPSVDDPVVIDCYLAPKSSLPVKVGENTIIDPSMIESGYIYIIATQFTGGTEITFRFLGGSLTISPYTPTSYQVFALENVNGSIRLRRIQYSQSLGQWVHTTIDEISVANIEALGSFGTTIKCIKGTTIPEQIQEGDDNYQIQFGDNIVQLRAFSDVDRTDILLNKIIAIPYFPSSYVMGSGVLVVPTDWEFIAQSAILKLKNLNTKFLNQIETTYNDPVKVLFAGVDNSMFVDYGRNDNFEPKIHHSDFEQYKFVYDSFSYQFKMETMGNPNDPSLLRDKFTFNFIHTNTMNSRMLFQFLYERAYIQEDFENLLSVARNNEVVIYNSPYLNYLRTSYNYDVKAKERARFTTELGMGLGVAGQSLGIGIGLASGNPALAIQSALSGATGIVSTLINGINSVAQAEENFQRKQAELSVQGVSVSGADDLDLLEHYSDNKAYYLIYEPSSKMRQLLFDLFYYTGYNTNEFKVPDVHTRKQFNFLQCELKISHFVSENNVSRGGVYIPDDCMAEIINKFSAGATFIHHYNNTWDMNQVSSNFETYLGGN